jgi:hypothetical protein
VDVKILAEKVRVVAGDLKLCFSSDSAPSLIPTGVQKFSLWPAETAG